MSDNVRKECQKFGIGLLIGLLGGATAALLFAPHEGKKTRAIIKEKIVKLKDKLPVGKAKNLDDVHIK